jgi:hypothetical protein
MNQPHFDLASVETWAYSSSLDEAFSRHEESDPDWFQLSIGNACSLEDVFRYAADPRCLKRLFFAQLLVPQLCWIYRVGVTMPFHCSRMQGLMGKEDYLNKVREQSEAIYTLCEIIERMRLSDDPALQAFAKTLLDHRWKNLEPMQEEYAELLRSLHADVVPLFAGT